uniref:C2H2-type domain-containing protein n=1 Tax=Globisporangium ultimum (strain ATCC 200006 / CBS 805.95 / DAOM BR144) TaxID=431595 RepID=K3WQK4_GLOUD
MNTPSAMEDAAELRPFACPETGCNARFRRKFALREHIKIHTGEKPYQCTVKSCGQRFRTSGNYTRHQRLHAAKKFVCHVKDCHRVFGKAESLSRHVNGHLGRMTGFACPVEGCEKNFTTSGNAKRHMRAHHSGALGLKSPSIAASLPPSVSDDASTATLSGVNKSGRPLRYSGIEPLEQGVEPLSTQDLSILLQCLFTESTATAPVVAARPTEWLFTGTSDLAGVYASKSAWTQDSFAYDDAELTIAVGGTPMVS